MLPILAAAALAAAPGPLPPEGVAPLTIAGPEGLRAGVVYEDSTGAQRRVACAAPCTLQIPRGAAFRLVLHKDGVEYRAEPVAWARKGVLGMRRELEPATITAQPWGR
jgi:hypothetical protein